MKLKADIAGDKLDVEIVRNGDRVTASVDGREYDLTLTTPEPDLISLWDDKGSTEFFVDTDKQSRAKKVYVNGRQFDIDIIDPRNSRIASSAEGSADGTAEIKSAMPGKIVRILVETGSEIAKGDGVIVVEAMKMQNELKAPKDGIVREIRAVEGSAVNAGDILVVIE